MHAFGATDVEHECAAHSLQAENAHVHILALSIMLPVFGGSESSRILSKISEFVFQKRTKVLRVQNDMRVNNY